MSDLRVREFDEPNNRWCWCTVHYSRFYLLKQTPDEPGYDEAEGFVVQSDCAKDARQIASENAGDEGAAVWLDAKRSTCKIIDPHRKTPHLILKSFHGA